MASRIDLYICDMSEALVNRVANSGLISIDLQDFLPGDIVSIDLEQFLYMGLILREKEFREALKNFDWDQYKDRNVSLICSADAVIPMWAYMLLMTYLQPVAGKTYVGSADEMKKHLFLENIASVNTDPFIDQRIVIKGCGDATIDSYAYAAITARLLPVVKSIMYGEPCSTVPVYKKR